MFNRSERMGDEIRRILAGLVQRRLSDPRINENVSITGVKLSRDLGVARVYYSVYGDDQARQGAAEAFEKAGGFLRRELASQLRSRKVPRLLFIEDSSIRDGEAIDELIRRVRQQDEAKAPQRMEEEEDERIQGGGEPTA
ncbi:MAG: 30S ribosome-binding factor RbfA [Clostridiaceae bacterium]|nr:30S ribosome-binding factor RbfA [Clostridiaceae bacterium]